MDVFLVEVFLIEVFLIDIKSIFADFVAAGHATTEFKATTYVFAIIIAERERS
jgi:hypothetical protein